MLAGARHPVVPDADRPEEQVLRAEQVLASRPGDLSVELQRSPTSGLVLAKRIRGRTEQTYAYRANGQMRAQTDADGVTTELEFDALGDVSGMSYSDGTPPVSIIHTRLGQLAALRSAGVEVTYGYDSSRLVQLRRTGSNVLSHVCAYTYTNAHAAQIACDLAAGSWSNRIEYDYGPGARIRELRDRDLVVRYSIGVGLVLADVTIGRRQGPPLLSLHQQWDVARELVVERRWQGSQGTGLVYTVARHPTTRRVESARWSDGVEWTYRYDQAQHLSAAACRRTLDFGSFPLFTHGYAWNSAGDPTLAGPVRNGVSVGNAFDSDPLNLLVQREWEPLADVWGRVQEDPLITVSVNDQACLRLGPWFHCRLALDPAPAADTVPVTVRAVRGAQVVEQTGFLRRPASVEKPLYSRAGTLVKDSQYRYRHDARGNLLALEPLGVGVAPRLAFTYYPDGLRATKSVFTWSGQAWTLARRHRYAYDRMCLVYEEITELRDGKSAAWTREYLWGLDQADQASGSFRQEAGGVGGLVAVKVRRGASCRLLIPMCDAHGNIVRLFDADRQEMAAEFTYTPFGEMVGSRVGEPALADFPLRFRSQYYDVESGLYYMGNRYYDPRTTKWLTSTRSAWEKVPAGNATGFSGGNPLP